MTKMPTKKATKKALNEVNGAQNSNGMTYSKETYLTWLEEMVRIRLFEERVLAHYGKEVKGFCHVYIGQEAIAAGMKTALKPNDAVTTAYRQHGIAISRGISSRAAMAELFGRYDGIVKGKGGSMHFFSNEHRFFGGNGIVGAQIPIGTGIALAEKYRGTDLLCVTMFGDGAARQGALYESFNMAMTWKLPVLYVCENNLYAMGTSVERTSNVRDIHQVGEAFDMPNEAVDGLNPEATHEAFARAAAHIRAGKGPYFLEMKTYRHKGHSVSDPAKYRTREEVAQHTGENDPIYRLRERILSLGIATKQEMEEVEARMMREIDDAEAFAIASPPPPAEELYTDNYVQADYPFMKD